ncbi:hypothetical protein Ciccas_010575 [Cichlidogyrus casuarinus]|uniref:Uncharacterized protein n=1 Tax=Cichlidogyrus casuarinus TaxID=1844966 RepID=A0ABD2PYD3_9PLAT
MMKKAKSLYSFKEERKPFSKLKPQSHYTISINDKDHIIPPGIPKSFSLIEINGLVDSTPSSFLPLQLSYQIRPMI